MLEGRDDAGVEAAGESCKECQGRPRGRGRDVGKRVASTGVGQHAGKDCKGHSTKKAKVPSRILRIGRIRVFRPKVGKKEDFEGGIYRFLQKSDIFSVLTKSGRYISRVEVNSIYKRKIQKVYPVDLEESDRSKLGSIVD